MLASGNYFNILSLFRKRYGNMTSLLVHIYICRRKYSNTVHLYICEILEYVHTDDSFVHVRRFWPVIPLFALFALFAMYAYQFNVVSNFLLRFLTAAQLEQIGIVIVKKIFEWESWVLFWYDIYMHQDMVYGLRYIEYMLYVIKENLMRAYEKV